MTSSLVFLSSRSDFVDVNDLSSSWLFKTAPDVPSDSAIQKWILLVTSVNPNRKLLFFRSYVRAFYCDLRVANANSGPVITDALGDAHPQNFGFLPLGDGTQKLLFNDFDDSGSCPVGFDIVRYFTALKL